MRIACTNFCVGPVGGGGHSHSALGHIDRGSFYSGSHSTLRQRSPLKSPFSRSVDRVMVKVRHSVLFRFIKRVFKLNYGYAFRAVTPIT